jgi:heptaprenyl diphosphate synthase
VRDVLGDPALAGQVASGLEAVERLLADSCRSDYPFVAQTSAHLALAGGKRFRPLLVLLAAHLGDPHAPGVVPAATAVELIHLATLYHDDVMDEAAVRRGTTSANLRWGNSVAILTGDFLFARASALLADLGPEAVRIQAETFERLVTGQIRETVGPQDGEDSVAHYLAVLADKTGSLIATSARYGAMMAGAPPQTVEVVRAYGEALGIAFQLADDLLDVVGEATQVGKAPGTDLREGVATLPVLLARTGDDPRDQRLRTLLDGDLTDADRHAEALRLLQAHPAVGIARDELAKWVDRARDMLTPLPQGPARTAMSALCDVVATRVR